MHWKESEGKFKCIQNKRQSQRKTAVIVWNYTIEMKLGWCFFFYLLTKSVGKPPALFFICLSLYLRLSSTGVGYVSFEIELITNACLSYEMDMSSQ